MFNDNLIVQKSKLDEMSYENILSEEVRSFTVDKGYLHNRAQLTREQVILSNAFTFGNGEAFDFIKFSAFRNLIDDLAYAIDNEDIYDDDIFLALKKVIVSLDLELGVDIKFLTSFYEMIIDDAFDYRYDIVKNDYNFDGIFHNYYNKKRGITI